MTPVRPSAVTVVAPEQAATPEGASRQTNVTTTSEVVQPESPGDGDCSAAIVGGVMSIRKPPTTTLPTFPAWSTAVPVADSSIPSVATVAGAEQVATPESPSEQLN
ncbi:MAG TPA: hypothetical protein VFV62_05780, partial [Gaiellaceae bacterium]|nr:hypothetical protein [Gaiellaceae bacterium]